MKNPTSAVIRRLYKRLAVKCTQQLSTKLVFICFVDNVPSLTKLSMRRIWTLSGVKDADGSTSMGNVIRDLSYVDTRSRYYSQPRVTGIFSEVTEQEADYLRILCQRFALNRTAVFMSLAKQRALKPRLFVPVNRMENEAGECLAIGDWPG